jgi:ubiquinone/menaquinone biosynthesis C-methylase UbiE
MKPRRDMEAVLAERKALWNEVGRQDNVAQLILAEETPLTKEEFYESGRRDVERLCLPFFQKEGFDPAGNRVLDLGCGAGRTARPLSQIFGEAYGIDISEEMVNVARKWNEDRPNLHFDTGSGGDLKIYEDDRFDFVFSCTVLPHVPRREIINSYLHEVDRVLKPGGLFQIQVAREWYRFGGIPVHRTIVEFVVTKLAGPYSRLCKLVGTYPWLGVSVSRNEFRRMLADTSLEVIEVAGEEGGNHWWCKGRKRD